jgi:hypothetical protein
MMITLLLCTPATLMAATFGELAATFGESAASQRVPSPPLSSQAAYRRPYQPGGRYADHLPPPPRATETPVLPPDSMAWTYGQTSTIDNPYTWEFLDNRYLWARWGNPLAPWISLEMSDWWRRRSGDRYGGPRW